MEPSKTKQTFIFGLSFLASLLLTAQLLTSLTTPAFGAAGGSPASSQFYGSVTNNGSPVGAGYVVTATIGSIHVVQTTTDSQGRYGYDPVFQVNATEGARVQFLVNGAPVLQSATLQSGARIELDLTVYGASSSTAQASCPLTPRMMPVATVGRSYSAQIEPPSGGVMPYKWSVNSDSLPQGLSLDSSTGIISGIPTSAQTCVFTVLVSDNSGHYCSLNATLQVNTSSASNFASNSYPTTSPTGKDQTLGSNAVTAPAIANADFDLSNLVVEPAVADPGDQITISVQVANVHPFEVTKLLSLKIDNSDESQKEVTLAAGKSETVNFLIYKNDPGDYTLNIGDQTASLHVNTINSASQQLNDLVIPVLAFILVGGLLIVVLVIMIIVRRRSYI